MKLLLFVCLFTFLNLCGGAKILGVIPVPSYSHQVVFQPLWKELSLRGHDVTVLTTNPINDPLLTNLTEIDLKFSYKFLEDDLARIIKTRTSSVMKSFTITLEAFANVVDAQLQHPEVQKLLNDRTQHFDLLIVEYFLVAPIYLSRKFNCPYIGVLSLDAANLVYQAIGGVGHPIVYPNQFLSITENSNVFQRVYLVLMEIWSVYFFDFNTMQEEIVKKHFQDSTPSQAVLENVTMLFVNTDFVFNYVRPLLPSVIPIGGNIARIPVKPLQENIRKFLNEANQGFIYFSLGSNVKSSDIPDETMNAIVEAFQELSYKVLWKYDLDELANKPYNVMTTKWVSQMEVLKHPNLKLFITHGGAQSMEETIFARVPVVGMPFFADQYFNIQKMVKLGFALSVDYKHLSKDTFKCAILEVINNQQYRKRISELADLADDQPMTGLERAVWWTEYVIRHKGASHFRSPALDMPWYQYYLLDVIGVVLTITLTIVWLIYLLVRCTFKLFYRTFKYKEKAN